MLVTALSRCLVWVHLSERQRYSVLRVCAADLNDVIELERFGSESVVERLKTRQKNLVNLFSRGDVHGGGERVIGALQTTTTRRHLPH